MFRATRLFAAGLKEKQAQRCAPRFSRKIRESRAILTVSRILRSFYNLVLLPRMRDDISQHKRLNHHLYQAAKKALFKPTAFIKGILLPLVQVSYQTVTNRLDFLKSFANQSKFRDCEFLILSVPILHCRTGAQRVRRSS